jgi:molecular chaperone GrpE (heat shock protein)
LPQNWYSFGSFEYEAKEAHARANAEAYNARNRMEQETEKTKKLP